MKIASSLIALFLTAAPAFASGTSVGNGRVGCREGATDALWVQNGDGAGAFERYLCRRGRWVNLAPAPPAPAKGAACREGRIEYFPVGGEGHAEATTFVCRDGRFVPIGRR